MNAERFQMLIETLERPRPPEIRFDMRSWRKEIRRLTVSGDVCGTAACAVGFYLMDHPNEELKYDEGLSISIVYVGLSVYDPESLVGFRACARYWGITRHDAEFLFSARSYGEPCNPTKAQVLDRIRKFYEERINADGNTNTNA